MDKVKIILAGLKKHHFWVLCGVVLVSTLVTWQVAVSSLADHIAKRRSTIESKRSSLLGLTSGSTKLVNDALIAADEVQTAEVKKQAREAWQRMYDHQKEKNKWPAELGSEFLDVIASLKPGDPIPDRYREIYQVFINQHFPAMCEIIDIRMPQDTTQDGELLFDPQTHAPVKTKPLAEKRSSESNRSRQEVWLGKVFWREEDLKRISSQFYFPQTPSSQMVWLAQEDLWVYEALLRAIRDTNEGATGLHNAAIKQVDSLEIGQAAAMSFDKSTARLFNLPSATAAATPMAGMAPAGSGGSGGVMMEGGQFAGGKAAGPTDSRYVDLSGKPLRAADPKPFAEFNMMPVRMLLKMNQTKVSSLLVRLANSSMPVEVRRVSIRPGKGKRLDFSRYMTAAAPGGAPGMPGAGMGEVPGGMMAGGAAMESPGLRGPMLEGGPGAGMGSEMAGLMEAGGKATEGFSPEDLDIEIEGIIFIYNYPEDAKLGTGAATTEAAPAGATPAAPPGTAAAVPPAAATPAAAPPAAAPRATMPAAAPAAGPGIPAKP